MDYFVCGIIGFVGGVLLMTIIAVAVYGTGTDKKLIVSTDYRTHVTCYRFDNHEGVYCFKQHK
jgi:hypothetical protein